MIPDKFIICVRKQISKIDCTASDNYAVITGVNITFNNAVGLLSNHNQRQLYQVSLESGLSSMSWQEFSGSVVSVANIESTRVSEPRAPYEGLGAYTGAGGTSLGCKLVPTVGSVLCVDCGTQLGMSESYLAPGSLGQFSAKIQVTCFNPEAVDWVAGDAELVIIPQNSGILVCERGSCAVYTGLLTREDVLNTVTEQEPYTKGSIKRMVGGGFLDSLKSGLQWIQGKLPMVRQVLSHVPNEYAQKASKALEAVGYGKHSKGKLENRLM